MCFTFTYDYLLSVRNIDIEHPIELPTRTYPSGKVPAVVDVKDHFQTAIGLAFAAFNSRLGVPEDVHSMIHTCVRLCDTCCLVRTIPADQAHRDSDGNCRDPGECESSVVVMGKGKGKVVVVPVPDSDDEDEVTNTATGGESSSGMS